MLLFNRQQRLNGHLHAILNTPEKTHLYTRTHKYNLYDTKTLTTIFSIVLICVFFAHLGVRYEYHFVHSIVFLRHSPA